MMKRLVLLIVVVVLMSTMLYTDTHTLAQSSEYYTVTFVVNNPPGMSIQVDSQQVLSGGKATKPDTPPASPYGGYYLYGWYLDGRLYDFDEVVTDNITLYASWIHISHPPPPKKVENPFVDISESDWFYDDVMYILAIPDTIETQTTFRPKDPVTRAEFITVLWRIAGSPPHSTPITSPDGFTVPSVLPFYPFDDVTEYSPYPYPEAIAWASAKSIIYGIGGRRFAPDAEITRQDMSVILMRYLQSIRFECAVTDEYRVFADENDISDYAKDAVQTLNKLGIVRGRGNNVIDPLCQATRAEMVAVLHRVIVLVE